MEIRPSPKWACDPWFCHSCGSTLGIGRYPRFKNGTRTDACYAMVAHRGPMRYIVLFRRSTSEKRTKGLEAPLALGAHAYD